MKLFYTILSVLLTGSLCQNTLSAADVPVVSYTLYDLTHDQLNSVHVDSEGNGINISTFEPTVAKFGEFQYLADIDNPLFCLGGTLTNPPLGGAAFYTKAVLRGTTGTAPTASPHILMELSPEHTLSKIQISGYSSTISPMGYSDLACMFSMSGLTNNDFKNADGDVFYIDGLDCASPEIEIPAGAKYIKLISTDPLSGSVGVTEFDSPVLLYAIQFYVNKNGSGVEESANSTFEMTQKGLILNFTESANISIYNLAGVNIQQLVNRDEVDLSVIASGVYIIKASSVNGGDVITRKIILQ